MRTKFRSVIPLDEPSCTGLRKSGTLVDRARRDGDSLQRRLEVALGTRSARTARSECRARVRKSLVRALSRQSESVNGSLPEYGNAEEFADRRDVGFAVRAVKPFGDVEDDVGAFGAEALGEVFVGFEADDVADRRRARRRRRRSFRRNPTPRRRRALLGGSSLGTLLDGGRPGTASYSQL